MTTPTNLKRPKIALAGLGESGMYYLERLLLRDDCQVVAGADPASLRRDHALPFVPNCRSRPEALLDDDGVDILWITGESIPGPELAAAALRSGKHIVIEPRSVGNARNCRRLVALSQAVQRAIVPIVPRRFDDDFVAVRTVVDSGELGALESLERTVWQLSPPRRVEPECDRDEPPGGDLFDEALFGLVDQAILLAGRPGQRVWCQRDPQPANGAGLTRLLIDFGAETTAWLNLSGRTPANLDTGWRVQGRLGSFVGGVQSTATTAGELIDVPISVAQFDCSEPVESILRFFAGQTVSGGELTGILSSFLALEAGQMSASAGQMIKIDSTR